MNFEKIDIKIKFVEQKELKAILALDFGWYVVRGFRVLTSEYANSKGDKLWIIPPSYRDATGKYHPIYFIPDKKGWTILQDKIWEEYYKQKEEYNRKRFDYPDI